MNYRDFVEDWSECEGKIVLPGTIRDMTASGAQWESDVLRCRKAKDVVALRAVGFVLNITC